MFETAIGILAGVLTSASMLPQLIKVIKERDAEGLSPVTLAILITGVATWTWYGILKSELPITLSNGIAIVINGTLLTCYFLFNKKKGHH